MALSVLAMPASSLVTMPSQINGSTRPGYFCDETGGKLCQSVDVIELVGRAVLIELDMLPLKFDRVNVGIHGLVIRGERGATCDAGESHSSEYP